VIARSGRPVIFLKTSGSTAGTHTNIVTSGVTGTSVATIGVTTASDDFEPYFVVTNGGTIGVAGILFKYSLDGGRTLSTEQALGIATSFVFPNSGGISYAFAAGTLVTGDVVTSRTTAPKDSASDLTTACAAMAAYGGDWEGAFFASPLTATELSALDTAFSSGLMLEKFFVGTFRTPTVGESDATYQSAFSTAFSAAASTHGGVCAGACEVTSYGLDFGRVYRRSCLFEVASELAQNTEEIDISAPALGSLPARITDTNGNPKHHNESRNPGLDAMRAITLTTYDGLPGTYITNPNLMSAVGSDFQYVQHRRVLNLGRTALRQFFTFRLSVPVLVDANNGKILESEAREIEAGATAALSDVLLAKPKASAVSVTLSRNDNILATKVITVQASVTSLAYPKTFNIQFGFRNPAVQAVNQ
jgi:hypothetical protein